MDVARYRGCQVRWLPDAPRRDGVGGLEEIGSQLPEPCVQVLKSEWLAISPAFADHQIGKRIFTSVTTQDKRHAAEFAVVDLSQSAAEVGDPEPFVGFLEQADDTLDVVPNGNELIVEFRH